MHKTLCYSYAMNGWLCWRFLNFTCIQNRNSKLTGTSVYFTLPYYMFYILSACFIKKPELKNKTSNECQFTLLSGYECRPNIILPASHYQIYAVHSKCCRGWHSRPRGWRRSAGLSPPSLARAPRRSAAPPSLHY